MEDFNHLTHLDRDIAFRQRQIDNVLSEIKKIEKHETIQHERLDELFTTLALFRQRLDDLKTLKKGLTNG